MPGGKRDWDSRGFLPSWALRTLPTRSWWGRGTEPVPVAAHTHPHTHMALEYPALSCFLSKELRAPHICINTRWNFSAAKAVISCSATALMWAPGLSLASLGFRVSCYHISCMNRSPCASLGQESSRCPRKAQTKSCWKPVVSQHPGNWSLLC